MDGFWGTLLVLVIVAVIVGLAVFCLVRNKIKGKSSCGSCCSCPMEGKCKGSRGTEHK